MEGIVTPACDLYSLAMIAGERCLPNFDYKLNVREQFDTAAKRTAHLIKMTLTKAREAHVLSADELKQLERTNPEDFAGQLNACIKSKLQSDLSEPQLSALKQFKIDMQTIHEVFSLVNAIIKADGDWYAQVEADEDKKATQPGYVSLKDKIIRASPQDQADIGKEIYKHFRSAAQFAERIRRIREHRSARAQISSQ